MPPWTEFYSKSAVIPFFLGHPEKCFASVPKPILRET